MSARRALRILYHHRTLADGAEGIHIQEMVEAFRAMGHQVRIHALATAAARGEGRSGVWSRLKAALPAPAFELAAAAYNAFDYLSLMRTLRAWRPDVVYKRHAMYDVGVARAARRLGIPVVLEVNRPYSLQTYFEFEPVWFPRLLTAFERDALNTASVVAAVSTPLASHLAPLCREPRRIVVLPNGANPQRFRFDAAARDRVRARLGLEGAVVVGWSGILRAWHGLDLLLDAAARIPGSRLMIVGDGADRPRLTAHAARLGLADRLVITGRVPHDEVPHYIAAMDIAVVAHDRTGVASPMKLLEYMAIGRAVVAPRLPNIQDIISEEVDGLLFDPGSVDALAAALQRLATHESIRQALGSQARVKIERERNWGNNAARVLEALDAIEPRPARIRANSEARI